MIRPGIRPVSPALDQEEPHCPPRSALEEFVHGELSPPEMREVEMHRRRCKDCQKIVTYLYRSLDLPYNQPMRE